MSNYEDNVKQRIAEFLRKVSEGRQNATPRAILRKHMAECGYPMSDRTMRRFYSTMPFVGYAIDGAKRGLFWISSKEEAVECERLRKSQGKACIRHGADTAKEYGIIGQMELFT